MNRFNGPMKNDALATLNHELLWVLPSHIPLSIKNGLVATVSPYLLTKCNRHFPGISGISRKILG